MPLLHRELEWPLHAGTVGEFTDEVAVKDSIRELKFTERAQVIHIVGVSVIMILHKTQLVGERGLPRAVGA